MKQDTRTTPPPIPQSPDMLSGSNSETIDSNTRSRSRTTSESAPPSIDEAERTEPTKFEQEKERILLAVQHFEIEINGEQHPERLQQALLRVMETLHSTMHGVTFNEEDEYRFNNFTLNLLDALIRARNGSEQDIQKIFNGVFREFSDVIDHGYLSQTRFSGQSVEDMVHAIYGRTPEEVESLKQQNRTQVVDKLEAYAQDPVFTLDMLLDLYRTNNASIIPTQMARFRDTPDTHASIFGRAKRIGLLPGEQVRREMKLFEERANTLIDKRALGMDLISYQVRVAKLHDELLDMHPFADRNGSTALLFAELMMAKAGYTPSRERSTNYYEHVATIFQHNYIAVGVVGYQHYLTKFVPGYYKPGVKTTEEAHIMETAIERTAHMRPQKKGLRERISGIFKRAA